MGCVEKRTRDWGTGVDDLTRYENRRSDISEGQFAKDRESWLAGQREALAAALNDAPLAESLGILARTVTEQLGGPARAGFYLANAQGTALHHVVGMSAEYAEAVDGFEVGPDSLACGLATHTGQPVLTADVRKDPLWRPWLWMAEKFGYRACWSFPIHTRQRNFVGTLAIYWPEPYEATDEHCELASTLTQVAGIIIARHIDSEARKQTEKALRENQARLESELADTKLLQNISAELALEGNVDALYEKILSAAVKIMRSQYGSMQMFFPERGQNGELLLLAAHGFSPEATKFWKWVRADSGCTCGQVLRTADRVIAEDVESCDFMTGTPDREALLQAGIHAAQSTPLFSRSGVLVGMISTHWDRPHRPTDRDLSLLDILARQAADLIERKKNEQKLREREERFRAFTETSFDVIYRMSADWTEMQHLSGRAFIPDTLEPSRTWLDRYIHPEDHETVTKAIRQAIRSKGAFELEHRVIQMDGTLGWTHSRAIPIFDDHGEILEWFGAARDITERKRGEDALRHRSERMELLSETLAQLLNAGDPDLLVREMFPKVAHHLEVDTYFNFMVNDDGSALKLHSCAGIPEEEARAIERLEFGQAICGTVAATRVPIHATDIQQSDYDKAALVRGYGIQCYACNPLLVGDRLLGTLSFASHTRKAFDDDELQFMRIVAQYTAIALDRLQGAKQLRDSEERFRMLADNMNQLAWTCDNLGDVNWYNKRWLDYTGLSFEEMKDWGWKQVQHPDHVDRVVASVFRSRESGEGWEDTFPLRGKDGKYRWFLSRAVPIRDTDGKIVRWFGTNTDITERKQAEDTQRLLLNELNHRVKNMLAVVQAIAQRTSARTRDPAAFAASFGGRIQSLARVHTLLSGTSWQGADLRELIRDQLLSGTVDERRFTAKGPVVRLEAQQALHLALVLHELGTNSIKYGALSSPTGTVVVTWVVVDSSLRLSWMERGGPRVEKPSQHGFGITLIEQSARGQGGSASVSWVPDGITWDIFLPLSEGPADTTANVASGSGHAVEKHVATRSSQPLSGRRFLVVEDEPLIGLDIVAALEDAQAQVEGPVGTTEKAIELIEANSLDGVLLDANLHGRPVDEIAALLARRRVPFVFVTGHRQDSLPEGFRHMAILSKPCSPQQVIAAAAQLVNGG
jgi:PAS domain S-box-containing protein